MKQLNRILLLLMISSASCNEKNPATKQIQVYKQPVLSDTLPTFLYYTYGELPPHGYIYYDTILKTTAYQLQVKNMGGCEPVNVDYNILHLHNIRLGELLFKNYGKNWKSDFEQQTKQKLMLD